MASTPTIVEVRNRYPEFQAAPDLLLGEKIVEAIDNTNANAFGTQLKAYLMLFTAHLLALTPQGEKMRLKDGTTVYEKALKQMRIAAALGRNRVA